MALLDSCDDMNDVIIKDDELDMEEEGLFREIRIVVDKGQSPIRIDKFLIDHVANTSRNKIQQAADAGSISVNGKVVKSNYKVKPCDVVVITLNTRVYDSSIVPEDIPLEVVYEDDDLMVVNKPA